MACKPKSSACYAKESLQNAINTVQGGSSVNAVAKDFGVLKSTLHNHVSGKYKRTGSGGRTVLALQDEQEIVLSCQALAEMGFGITRSLVETVIADYIHEKSNPNCFVNGIPGRDWWKRFMKRWPALRECKPQHLSKLTAFFSRVEVSFKESGLDPSNPTIAECL